MDIQTETIFDNGTPDMCFSLKKQKYITVDGMRHDIGQPERVAVCPGDFDIVESFAPELLQTFETLWAPDVVRLWAEHQRDAMNC